MVLAVIGVSILKRAPRGPQEGFSEDRDQRQIKDNSVYEAEWL